MNACLSVKADFGVCDVKGGYRVHELDGQL